MSLVLAFPSAVTLVAGQGRWESVVGFCAARLITLPLAGLPGAFFLRTSPMPN